MTTMRPVESTEVKLASGHVVMQNTYNVEGTKIAAIPVIKSGMVVDTKLDLIN